MSKSIRTPGGEIEPYLKLWQKECRLVNSWLRRPHKKEEKYMQEANNTQQGTSNEKVYVFLEKDSVN